MTVGARVVGPVVAVVAAVVVTAVVTVVVTAVVPAVVVTAVVITPVVVVGGSVAAVSFIFLRGKASDGLARCLNSQDCPKRAADRRVKR